MRLIAGKRAIAAQPGEAVNLYTGGGGHAPVLVVGTRPESSLIGWATPIAAAGATTTLASTGPGYAAPTPGQAFDETYVEPALDEVAASTARSTMVVHSPM
jgi:hypothetical protein